MQIEGRLYVHEQVKNRLRASHRHTKQRADGSWETTGYDDYTVWLVANAGHLQFAKGDVIEVTGTLDIRVSEYQGLKRKEPTINAWSVKKAERAAEPSPTPSRAEDEPPPPTDADAPDWVTAEVPL